MADISKVTVNGTTYNIKDAAVPAWAKESTKPTYTASEVGALPDTTVIPTKISDLTDDVGLVPAFLVTVTANENAYVADKTYAEIMDAISYGVYDILLFDGLNYFPYQGTNTEFSDRRNAHNFYRTKHWVGMGHIDIDGYFIGSDNVTYKIDETAIIPQKTSDLTNDSGYLTLATLPIYDGTVLTPSEGN